jgi:subtilisin family serine protease
MEYKKNKDCSFQECLDVWENLNRKRSIKFSCISVCFLIAMFLMLITQFTKYPTYIVNMKINDLWEESSGENITIAFLDSGMHESLVRIYGERVIMPYDFVNQTNAMTDTNGHGTSMICIASCNYEKTGIYGIAPRAKVMPLRIFDSNGNTNDTRIIEAIYYAVENGANIINLSFGSYMESAEVEAAIEFAVNRNVFVIASAGEHIDSLTAFPASYLLSIAIAQEKDDYGNKNNEIDFFVEGTDIESLRFSNADEQFFTFQESGSSVSTALFSGILALMLDRIGDNDRKTLLQELAENKLIYSIEDYIEKYCKGDE